MKLLRDINAAPAETRLLRMIAFTFTGAATIAALYLGQEVLLSTAVAILIAFIISPATTLLRRVLPLPLAPGRLFGVSVEGVR